MPRVASIVDVACWLPAHVLTNEQLAAKVEGADPEKIASKLGIRERRIAAPEECASDLAVRAAERLLLRNPAIREEVDYVLLCTQSPDYPLPSTACLIHHRLGLPTACGALDFNLGCSGYVAGLSLAKGLIETGQARGVLLVTGDTYSKYLDPADRGCRALFGDGASATFLRAEESDQPPKLGPFVFGTDGSGADQLIVRAGGCREPVAQSARDRYLRMDGPAIFAFTLKCVPEAWTRLLELSRLAVSDFDWFVFHQANRYMLEHLFLRLELPRERCPILMERQGNTVSTTIPLVLEDLLQSGRLRRGMRLALIGFGVGLSWAAMVVRW